MKRTKNHTLHGFYRDYRCLLHSTLPTLESYLRESFEVGPYPDLLNPSIWKSSVMRRLASQYSDHLIATHVTWSHYPDFRHLQETAQLPPQRQQKVAEAETLHKLATLIADKQVVTSCAPPPQIHLHPRSPTPHIRLTLRPALSFLLLLLLPYTFPASAPWALLAFVPPFSGFFLHAIFLFRLCSQKSKVHGYWTMLCEWRFIPSLEMSLSDLIDSRGRKGLHCSFDLPLILDSLRFFPIQSPEMNRLILPQASEHGSLTLDFRHSNRGFP